MMNGCRFVALVMVFVCCHPALAVDEKAVVEPSAVLSTLDRGHPTVNVEGQRPESSEKTVCKR